MRGGPGVHAGGFLLHRFRAVCGGGHASAPDEIGAVFTKCEIPAELCRGACTAKPPAERSVAVQCIEQREGIVRNKRAGEGGGAVPGAGELPEVRDSRGRRCVGAGQKSGVFGEHDSDEQGECGCVVVGVWRGAGGNDHGRAGAEATSAGVRRGGGRGGREGGVGASGDGERGTGVD